MDGGNGQMKKLRKGKLEKDEKKNGSEAKRRRIEE
jgi:hypothetical protein